MSQIFPIPAMPILNVPGGAGATGATGPAGAGNPGGSDTQIQYNNANTFDGTVGLTWDNFHDTLSLTGQFVVGPRFAASSAFLIKSQEFIAVDASAGELDAYTCLLALNPSPAVDFSSIYVLYKGTLVANGSHNYNELNGLLIQLTQGTSGTVATMENDLFITGPSGAGTLSLALPLLASVTCGTGTITEARAVSSNVVMNSNGTLTLGSGTFARFTMADGVVGDYATLRVPTPSISGGVVSHLYGLYIGDMTAGGGTANPDPWAIYVLGGNVGLASASILMWNSDAGISRLGAASLAIGNGTAGDFSGSLKLTGLSVQGALTDGSASVGIAGQVLTSTGAVVAWSSSKWNVYTVTAGATAAASDYILVDTTAGPVTIVLPTAATGACVRVKKKTSDANAVTVTGSIDGQPSWNLGLQFNGLEVTGNGAAWWAS